MCSLRDKRLRPGIISCGVQTHRVTRCAAQPGARDVDACSMASSSLQDVNNCTIPGCAQALVLDRSFNGTGATSAAFTMASTQPLAKSRRETRRSSSPLFSGGTMRNALFGLLIVSGAAIAGLPASAAPLGTAPQPQVRLVEQTQGYGFCRRLRRACEFKHERGEVGEGNCARYRRECGRYR